MPRRVPRRAIGLGLALALLLPAACNTQRYPGPMPADVKPLPAGEVPPGPYGPQEVVVYRLSDPVLVRRAGASTAFPIPVYDKRERVRSGASVQCAAGGRCELLWPQDASSVLMFDEGWVDLGEPSRDEPLVTFRRVTRARLILTPEDRVILMGGAELRGDPEEKSGPFLLERTRANLVQLTNQSKKACTVAFRDEEILLSPGELLRLPLLEAGGKAMPRDPAEVTLDVAGRAVRIVGDAEVDGTAIVAGPRGARVEDAGLLIRLEPGDRLELDVYSAPDPGGSAMAPTDEPSADEPAVEEPPLDEAQPPEKPVSDEPISDEPISDEPISDEPISDEPISDEPVSDEPVSDEPVSDDPASQQDPVGGDESGAPPVDEAPGDAPDDPADDPPAPATGDDPPAPPPADGGDPDAADDPAHALRASLPMQRALSALPPQSTLLSPQSPLAPDPS